MQLGISLEETLVLLSEDIIILFDKFYVHGQQLKEYSAGSKRADFLSRLIWVNLKIHHEMDAQVAGGSQCMRYNTALAMAFIRFLTKTSGGNNAASVGPRLDDLEADLEKVRKTADKTKDLTTRVNKLEGKKGPKGKGKKDDEST